MRTAATCIAVLICTGLAANAGSMRLGSAQEVTPKPTTPSCARPNVAARVVHAVPAGPPATFVPFHPVPSAGFKEADNRMPLMQVRATATVTYEVKP